MPKTYKSKNLTIILLCLCLVIVFNLVYFYLTKASPSSTIQFTADTIISLSGISDGDLYIRTDSECAELSVSGSVLTITDIPDANNFVLKTSAHNNGLKLTPSGGTLDLTLDSGDISSGDITQWTLNAASGTTVAQTVGVSNANTWHAIKTDSVLFNTFQSNSSGEVSFTYDDSWSEKVFTIEVDATSPTSFSLVSPVSGSNTSNSKPTLTWNASSDPDVSYYQLYIDSSLDTNSISGTSASSATDLSCGSHSWFVRAVDNAGNTTDSETFSLTMACGGGAPAAWSVSPKGEFKILINNGAEETDNRTVVLNLSAGSDTARMAISESSDFINASQETFSATKEYLLSENEGTKTIYAKFYTQYGVASEVVSDSIILKTILTEPAVSGDEKSEISPFAKSSAEVEEKPKTPIKVSAGEEIVPSVEEEISSEEETVSPKREISPSEKAEKEKPREEIVNAVKSFLRYIWQSIIRFLQRIWPF